MYVVLGVIAFILALPTLLALKVGAACAVIATVLFVITVVSCTVKTS